MKILVLNGSPRLSGNTAYATQEIAKNVTENSSNTIEVVNVTKLKVSGCIACDGCSNNGGNCVINDDSRYIMDKIGAADMVIFATPVYWWGVSAQLKAVIDKFYSAQSKFKTQKKKIGIIVTGVNPLTDKQYSLIEDQFSCICSFIGWERIFNHSFSAYETNDLQNSEETTAQLTTICETISTLG